MTSHYNQLFNDALLAEDAFDLVPGFAPGELVLHVPHASPHVPDHTGYVGGEAVLQAEIDLLTDWHTDKLFGFYGVSTLAPEFSRVFCDVERLPDAQEPLFALGRGFFYTRRDNGKVLRAASPEFMAFVHAHYYEPHHQALQHCVNRALAAHGRCLILDCHSFPDQPLRTDLDQAPDRPDICLGTDLFHSPEYLVDYFRRAFEAAGYSVRVNTPYAGTIVPTASYRQDPRVLSLMVEINRKLYLRPDYSLDPEACARFRQVLSQLLGLNTPPTSL